MKIKEIYKQLPTSADSYKYLESVIWNGVPVCPYCKSKASTSISKEMRYRCNLCKTSYSVTVGTIFHRTRLDIQKWLLAIYLVLNSDQDYGVRQLGRDLEVTKDTATLILKKIKQEYLKNPEFVKKLISYDND